MKTYDVEVNVLTREVYSVYADSPEEARQNWAEEGTMYVSEAIYVDKIVSVTEDDD